MPGTSKEAWIKSLNFLNYFLIYKAVCIHELIIQKNTENKKIAIYSYKLKKQQIYKG